MPVRTESLGERIKKLRNQKGISLRELAQLTDVSHSFINDIEKCRRYPAPAVLDRIAKELGVKTSGLSDLDNRVFLTEMKGLLDANPAWGPAFKKIANAARDGSLTPDDLLKKLGKSR